MIESRHLTDEEWLRFGQNRMCSEEEAELYGHISTCTYCAERFANVMEQSIQMPPAYLHEEILERSKKIDMQMAITVKKTSKRMRLFWYSLKIGFAVMASMMLLFATTSIQTTIIQPAQEISFEKTKGTSVTEKINERGYKITDSLNAFSRNILTYEAEEENYDTKKK